jgi:molecular chaperone GrpE (heat shock protein)
MIAASSAAATTAAPEQSEPLSSEEAQFQYFEYLVSEFQTMQSDMQRMYHLVEEISERETAQEKIFNTLHAELRDYKNDFIYEHMKPVVRPLLFLYDSLEQFDAEIALYERPNTGERRQTGLSPSLVRENISFFRDQLIEALRICEVTPMESPKGAFNPRMHKVIDVVPAEASQDGLIQRVVRGGWYLNGQLLRSAEVIVGKKMS